VVEKIIQAVNNSGVPTTQITEEAGLSKHAVDYLASGTNSSVANVEAMLSVIGYRLAVVPREE
jgi:DNA-binding phage protein